ncbi:MAG: HAMP domain-containing histidine kinase [Polyangiaceae bacterium]|nr:HAMP domain-containing histidine kinase [Polyangiaceae bacterium]
MKRIRAIPFVVVAPATVLLLSALVSSFLMMVGSRLLEEQAHRAAREESSLWADSLVQKLKPLAEKDWLGALHEANQQINPGRLWIEKKDGALWRDQPFRSLPESPQPVEAVRKLSKEGLTLHSWIPTPSSDDDKNALIQSLTFFSLLLTAGATGVAWALARDVHADVTYLRDLITRMSNEEIADSAEPIRIRSVDQVGQLTASFNTLLNRFQAAERAYQQDLQEANAFDSDRAAFLSALSHELRTPLNSILGFADVLLDEIDGPLSEEARENLTVVRTSGEHLRALIDDILALSALESGNFRLSRENLDLLSVAAEVVAEAQVAAQQKGLSIELERPDTEADLFAYADRRRIRQILSNVVSNAVKFTAKGSVLVSVARDGSNILLAVRDTGPGISESALEIIFEEFEQTGSDESKRQGTGLGLSITKRLTRMHGGTVKVESELGKGSTFFIRIPIRQKNLTPPSLIAVPRQTTIHNIN